jgi:ERCC4-related helicase
MTDIEPWGLHANSWQFLQNPTRYTKQSKTLGLVRTLSLMSTRRQFATARDILARLNGSQGFKPRRGVLLADDVGLGKTTVAAIVAWIARGADLSVRVLAPNQVMRRQWLKELENHIQILNRCAPHLEADNRHLGQQKRILKLGMGKIQVTTHWHAVKGKSLGCDLLIIDEAHRAKGDQSKFSKALNHRRQKAKRILVLTATPFSIQIGELVRMLKLIGAGEACNPVRKFDRQLQDLYKKSAGRDPGEIGRKLAECARDAVTALKEVVIRHGVDELRGEVKVFGERKTTVLDVPTVGRKEFEILLRTDRLLKLVRRGKANARARTNDPRFHVGWKHLDDEMKRLGHEIKENTGWLSKIPKEENVLIKHQTRTVRRLRKPLGVHPKINTVVEYVLKKVRADEKVVVFCHHHATAQEFAEELQRNLAQLHSATKIKRDVWCQAWRQIISREEERAEDSFLEIFVEWLASPLVQGQTEKWLGRLRANVNVENLVNALTEGRARNPQGPIISEAAINLFKLLTDPQSSSTRGVLRRAADDDRVELIPGGARTALRLMALCHPLEKRGKASFYWPKQPDTALAIFNSPFGPDVLIGTDALSEGIDLHSCCRTVIHYELNPSPLRTIQRNGRLRRINSWAFKIGKPIECSYPYYGGTRDEKLVKIMDRRLKAFSLLLGGVPEIRLDKDDWSNESSEDWRIQVVETVKAKLAQNWKALQARPPRRS